MISKMQKKQEGLEDETKKDYRFRKGEQDLEMSALVSLGKEIIELLKIIACVCVCILVRNVYQVVKCMWNLCTISEPLFI
jgi:hypothetical protein